jgi:uncharacterized membrane protein YphA (DoxX/SURF4 family)
VFVRRLARFVARPLLAPLFVVGGLDALSNPEPRAKLAEPMFERMWSTFPALPREPVALVQANAVLQVGAGSMLAVGILPRLAALVLAGSLVPTTASAHRFWELEDPATRAQQRTHFFKNLAILGGLLLAAFD